tara:strand:- start:111 stop:257 length:147 start_codon:yes stop_codon:yes gene_type:complete
MSTTLFLYTKGERIIKTTCKPSVPLATDVRLRGRLAACRWKLVGEIVR